MRMMNIRAQAALIGILVFNLALPLALALALYEGNKGRLLMEVFLVRINIDNPGDIYGTILIEDGQLSQYIYNRETSNYESIKPGENALLTGPAHQAISASNSITIDIDLALLKRDDIGRHRISEGRIKWNVKDNIIRYDRPIVRLIDAQYGSAVVEFAVLSNAVQGIVEVTLIDGDGENPADVYGHLAADNTKIGSSCQSLLFERNSGNYVSVRPGQSIPLSRSIVAVPLDSTLTVHAYLYDHDTFSNDDEIAKGTADFPAQLSGTLLRKIYGRYGQIQVKVTWS